MCKDSRKYPIVPICLNLGWFPYYTGYIRQCFKKMEEIPPESKVKIKRDRESIRKYLNVTWKRPYDSEKSHLFRICLEHTDSFLEFINKFLEKKGWWFNQYWETEYNTILTACELCEQDPRKFKESIRKAENLDEFKIAFAFRD